MMCNDGLSSIPSTISGFIQEPNPNPNPNTNSVKRKRNLPGTPDPDAEVIALSPKSLMAKNRFLCEICNKGFQRDQNLQLHRRGHNLPWKLKQRTSKEVRKKVYICPEKSCVHHDPLRALGDLTGIKKHYSRKHGEKKWKCEKCSKKYAVQSDWKAHSKICGTREYKCDCGTLFSRKDSFITHRAFCDALAEENANFTTVPTPILNFRNDLISGSLGDSQAAGNPQFSSVFRPDLVALEAGQNNMDGQKPRLPLWLDHGNSHLSPIGMASNNSNAYLVSNSAEQTTAPNMLGLSSQWLNREQEAPYNCTNVSSMPPPPPPRGLKVEEENKGKLPETMNCLFYSNQSQQEAAASSPMSATALLQKAAQMGSTTSSNSSFFGNSFGLMSSSLSRVTSFNSFNQNINNEVQKFATQPKHGENLNALSGSSINEDGLPLGYMNSSSLVSRSSRNLDPSMMMTTNNGKQSKASCNEVEHGMTRDFLGVGGGDGGRSLLQEQLVKFASMGSAMDLSPYDGSH